MGNGESWEWGGRFPAVDEIGVRRQGADCLIDSPFPIADSQVQPTLTPLVAQRRQDFRITGLTRLLGAEPQRFSEFAERRRMLLERHRENPVNPVHPEILSRLKAG